MQGPQAGHFGVIHSDHEFSADLVGDGMFTAEFHHLANARDGQPRLDRTGLVIQAAMQDAAVMAGLVAAHTGLLFQYGNTRARKALEKAVCGGQTHDAAADDDDSLGIHPQTFSVTSYGYGSGW